MNNHKQDLKNQQKMTFLTAALILLIGLAVSFFKEDPTDNSYLTFHNEKYLSILDEQMNQTYIYYKDILSVEYVNAASFGEANGGSVIEDVRLGQWKSEQFGTYQSCTETALTGCVILRTSDMTYAISSESENLTKELQASILEACEQASRD